MEYIPESRATRHSNNNGSYSIYVPKDVKNLMDLEAKQILYFKNNCLYIQPQKNSMELKINSHGKSGALAIHFKVKAAQSMGFENGCSVFFEPNRELGVIRLGVIKSE